GAPENGSAALNGDPIPRVGPRLALELTGDLPCVRCKYNLRGLTVKGMCPECGTSVRTTILAKIDPLAKELRPLHFPRLTSLGLIVWAWSALAAALCNWALRLSDFGGGTSLFWSLRACIPILT